MTQYASGTPVPTIPVTWTDDPFISDSIKSKKIHLVEMRAALEALDGHYHVFNSVNSQGELPNVAVAWVEASVAIIVDSTKIKASHYQEIIDFIKAYDGHYHYIPTWAVNSTTLNSGFTFTADPLVQDVTWIDAFNHEELRSHIETLAAHVHGACCECECECTCTCTCTCQCQCDCNCDCQCDSHI